jgi:hypothetical protein
MEFVLTNSLEGARHTHSYSRLHVHPTRLPTKATHRAHPTLPHVLIFTGRHTCTHCCPHGHLLISTHPLANCYPPNDPTRMPILPTHRPIHPLLPIHCFAPTALHPPTNPLLPAMRKWQSPWKRTSLCLSFSSLLLRSCRATGVRNTLALTFTSSTCPGRRRPHTRSASASAGASSSWRSGRCLPCIPLHPSCTFCSRVTCQL